MASPDNPIRLGLWTRVRIELRQASRPRSQGQALAIGVIVFTAFLIFLAGRPWWGALMIVLLGGYRFATRWHVSKELRDLELVSAAGRVALRIPLRSDEDALRRIAAQPTNVEAQGQSEIGLDLQQPMQLHFLQVVSMVPVDTRTGQVIGHFSLVPRDEGTRASIGVIFDADSLGQGLATEALGTFLAFWTRPPWTPSNTVPYHYETAEDNHGSRRLIERLGYRTDGDRFIRVLPDGRHINAVRYVIDRRPPEKHLIEMPVQWSLTPRQVRAMEAD